jgi:uncharacterized protein (DUF885 family)
MFDRRSFMLTSAAFGFAGLSGCATTAREAAGTRDQQLDALLSRWFQEDLRDNPTFATNLGLGVGELAPLRAQLGDASLASANEERAEAVARHRQLQAFGGGLTPAGQLNYDIAEFRQSVEAEGARFRFGTAGGRPNPYIISQLGGSY